MKLRVLGAFGGEGLGHRPTAFLINDRTLIDAGTVSSALTVPEQLSIEHALISHSHLDHVAGLRDLSETLGRAARGLHGPRAVILECAFPTRLGPLAEIAKHLTPALISRELDKLPPDLPVLIYHVKPQSHGELAEGLEGIGSARLSILEQDRTYAV